MVSHLFPALGRTIRVFVYDGVVTLRGRLLGLWSAGHGWMSSTFGRGARHSGPLGPYPVVDRADRGRLRVRRKSAASRTDVRVPPETAEGQFGRCVSRGLPRRCGRRPLPSLES